MAPIGDYWPIVLYPCQVVLKDPDGLIEHDREWLKPQEVTYTLSFTVERIPMKYRIEETATDWPWKYFVYQDGIAVAITLTKWGAKRLVRKMEKLDDKNAKG